MELKWSYPLCLCILLVACGEVEPSTSLTDEERLEELNTTFESPQQYTARKLDSLELQSHLVQHRVTSDDSASIWRFYLRRDMQYAWFVDDSITNSAWNFLNLFGTLELDPVDTAGQHGPLQKRVEDLLLNPQKGAELTDAQRADIELELTTQFFRMADRQYGGKVKKDLHELDWYIPRRKKNFNALIDALVAGKQDLSPLEPVNSQYRALKLELKRYQELARVKDSISIAFNADSVIQFGDTSAVLPAVRERLFELGDVFTPDTVQVLDSVLLKGVRRFRMRNGMAPTDLIDGPFISELQRPVHERVMQIMINMERTRWLPPEEPDAMLLVNIPEYRLHVFHGGKEVWDMSVVVGQVVTRTSIFNGDMNRIVFSPYWTIPKSIVAGEILPILRKDPSYLRRKNMEVLRGGKTLDASTVDWKNTSAGSVIIRQRPGAGNALGRVKFLFPNQYSIYLHDTPSKSKFAANDRAFSHGCIRLAEPERLANYLLRNDTAWTPENIHEAMYSGTETSVRLEEKMPVVIAYLTAWVDASGRMNFRNDVYGHDERLALELFGERASERLLSVR